MIITELEVFLFTRVYSWATNFCTLSELLLRACTKQVGYSNGNIMYMTLHAASPNAHYFAQTKGYTYLFPNTENFTVDQHRLKLRPALWTLIITSSSRRLLVHLQDKMFIFCSFSYYYKMLASHATIAAFIRQLHFFMVPKHLWELVHTISNNNLSPA